MKITFTQDHQSPYSGNSFYAVGTTADLQHGAELVALGVAREGWGVVLPVPTAAQGQEAPSTPITPVEVEIPREPLPPIAPAEIPAAPKAADTKRPQQRKPAAKRRAV